MTDRLDRAAPQGLDDTDELLRQLAAERAGAEHWREVARRRETALAELKGRTSVRAILAFDRHTAGARARAAGALDDVRHRLGTTAVAVRALPRRTELTARRRALAATVARVRSTPPGPLRDHRSILVVVTGTTEVPRWLAGDGTAEAGGRPLSVVVAPDAEAMRAAASATDADLICLVAATTAPLEERWLDRLAAPLTDTVVATVPLLVHPERGPRRATEHDLLVRSAGLEVRLTDRGSPALVSMAAGAGPDAVTAPTPVLAATAGALMVDRAALEASGGLVDLGDDDVSLVDLCLRLGDGGQVRCVPDALAFDARPVRSPARLGAPVDTRGRAWASLLDRHGPTLRRQAPGRDPEVLTFVLTVASPSAKVADRWGDWHLAEALARALTAEGHEATVQTLADVDSDTSRCADVHLVLRGLARVRRSPGQRHLLWIISHPEDLDDDELDRADLIFVASSRFADHLRARTATPVEVLLQATDPDRFRPRPVDPRHRHEVTVVGKSRDVLRPMVHDALAAGLRPAIYGTGWEGLVDPRLIVADHVPNEELPVVYSSAGVVLNDHWETMRTWGFVSNRIFDVLACGTPLVSDDLPEIRELFGDLVATWRTPAELAAAVAAAGRGPVGERARALVLDHHTFENRAARLLQALAGHHLDPRSRPAPGDSVGDAPGG